jgi:general secretion pathway protein D
MLYTVKRFAFLFVIFSFIGISISGCDLAKNSVKTDRGLDMEAQDYRDAFATRLPMDTDALSAIDSDIPDLKTYIAPPSDSLRAMPLVSISVNQTVPLRDILFELANQADYDIELDPRISGSIIFTARNRPLDLVVERIAEMAGLRYSFEDNSLRVELDTPFNKTYKVDYLSFARSTSSSIRNDVSVVTGSGANTGSGFEATSSSSLDLWLELSTSLQQILGVVESRGNLRTSRTPEISILENAAPVQPVIVQGQNGESVQVQAPEATLQVNALPQDLPGMEVASSSDDENAPTEFSTFSINKQAGIINVFATERQHKEVADYLEAVRRSVTSQVLIEAKILEVSLTDEFNVGINWDEMSITGKSVLGITLPQAGGFLDNSDLGGNSVAYTIGGNDVNAVINALSRFGTVRALSSPRITVLNNQSAVLNVAQNLVYFEIDSETTQSDIGPSVTTFDSEIRNVPEGVLINVQPVIDLDSRRISMSIRPTVTNVETFENDPVVALEAARANANIQSRVPIVQVQEFDSVMSMNSGQAIVMGGLMQDRVRSTQTGVPVLSEVPLIGAAFRAKIDKIEKTELIVFLRATIIEDTNIDDTDRDFYKKFSDDRRPLRL